MLRIVHLLTQVIAGMDQRDFTTADIKVPDYADSH